MTFTEDKLAKPAVSNSSSDVIYDIAANWVERTRSGILSDEDARAMEIWLSQDPQHLAAFRTIESTSNDFADMAERREYAYLLGKPTFREKIVSLFSAGAFTGAKAFLGNRRPTVGFALQAVAVALFVSWVVYDPTLREGNPSVPEGETAIVQGPRHIEYKTDTAEMREVRLSDGSVVTLSGDSQIAVTFSDQRRQVDLVQGQAFFSVVKDKSRPFFVDAGNASVRVVGTKFDVRRGPIAVNIAVLEGVVEVLQQNDIDGLVRDVSAQQNDVVTYTKKRLVAGQQITTGPAQILGTVTEQKITADDVATWRTGRFSYYGAPLLDVIADANRYYDGEILLASDDIGALEVSTSFTAAQVDQMLSSISLALALDIERQPNGTVVLKKAP
ncbi:MAG: FecR domain-containing protein [Porticoccaceae bacterium]|nr:FecR domain-containing protein [Porticoccaceae bacterium]